MSQQHNPEGQLKMTVKTNNIEINQSLTSSQIKYMKNPSLFTNQLRHYVQTQVKQRQKIDKARNNTLPSIQFRALSPQPQMVLVQQETPRRAMSPDSMRYLKFNRKHLTCEDYYKLFKPWEISFKME